MLLTVPDGLEAATGTAGPAPLADDRHDFFSLRSLIDDGAQQVGPAVPPDHEDCEASYEGERFGQLLAACRRSAARNHAAR